MAPLQPIARAASSFAVTRSFELRLEPVDPVTFAALDADLWLDGESVDAFTKDFSRAAAL